MGSLIVSRRALVPWLVQRYAMNIAVVRCVGPADRTMLWQGDQRLLQEEFLWALAQGRRQDLDRFLLESRYWLPYINCVGIGQ